MSENWYYSTGDGDTHGPMSAAELLAAAKRGELAEAGSVYHAEKTNGQWINATELPAIRSAIEGRAAVLRNRSASTAPPVVEPPPMRSSPVAEGEFEIRQARNTQRSRSAPTSAIDKLTPAYLFPNLDPRALTIANVIFGVFGFFTMLAIGIVAIALAVAVIADNDATPSNVIGSLAIPLVLPAFGVAALAMYMLPTILAYCRYHTNWAPIAIINAFSGWSGIGWILLVAWAMGSTVDPPKKPEPAFE